MTTTYSVTRDGKFLGRYSIGAQLNWVGPAQAACLASESEAAALAAHFEGAVCLSPRWDAAAKSYVVPQ